MPKRWLIMLALSLVVLSACSEVFTEDGGPLGSPDGPGWGVMLGALSPDSTPIPGAESRFGPPPTAAAAPPSAEPSGATSPQPAAGGTPASDATKGATVVASGTQAPAGTTDPAGAAPATWTPIPIATVTPTRTMAPTWTPFPTATPSGFSSGAPGLAGGQPGSGPTPTPEAIYQGSWTGTTSQGRSMTFTIQGNAVTSLGAGYATSGCIQADMYSSSNYGPAGQGGVAFSGDHFIAVLNPMVGTGVVNVSGTFLSNSRAEGLLSAIIISSTGGEDDAICTANANITWNANRN